MQVIKTNHKSNKSTTTSPKPWITLPKTPTVLPSNQSKPATEVLSRHSLGEEILTWYPEIYTISFLLICHHFYRCAVDIRNSLQIIMAGNSAQFSERFYANLFSHHPDLKRLFEGVDQKQQGVKLVKSLQVMVQYYLRPHPGMKNSFKILGQQHSQFGAKEEDYMAFEVTLLSTLGVLHGEQWNEEIAQQWREAFQLAADLMKEGYKENSGQP